MRGMRDGLDRLGDIVNRTSAPKGGVANPIVSRRRAFTVPLSCFVHRGKSEAVRQQLVLLAHGPGT